ncbi:EthD family reductase [uncultured Polaribacter sp.]|uniref:EthD family reductase n=1 Tax=uncultured Polaribacter sp. TaxID=174711 RepID=UPI00260ED63A|nr:EthD family reductase [uncultured Polaribacter sp.]
MKSGMIKLSVMYPKGEGKTFDMNYYLNTHIPLVGKLLGDAIKGATVEEGIAGGAPGTDAIYAAMGNIYFESLESFQSSFGPNAPEILADLPNFTNTEPTVQISKVLV